MESKLTATSKRRIATLIKFMRSLPKSAYKHFNMSGWVFGAGRDNAYLTQEKLHTCNTSACAAGWGATISAFNRAGFRYNTAKGFSIDPAYFFGVKDKFIRTARGLTDMERVLFMNDAKTPKEWARMAESAVKRYERQTA